MPRYNRQNIDRKTNKPSPTRTEGLGADVTMILFAHRNKRYMISIMQLNGLLTMKFNHRLNFNKN
jgi:hypothetical protein